MWGLGHHHAHAVNNLSITSDSLKIQLHSAPSAREDLVSGPLTDRGNLWMLKPLIYNGVEQCERSALHCVDSQS